MYPFNEYIASQEEHKMNLQESEYYDGEISDAALDKLADAGDMLLMRAARAGKKAKLSKTAKRTKTLAAKERERQAFVKQLNDPQRQRDELDEHGVGLVEGANNLVNDLIDKGDKPQLEKLSEGSISFTTL